MDRCGPWQLAWRALLPSLAVVAWAVSAQAQDSSPASDSAAESNPHAGGFWERDVLTGDWGGMRSQLESQGIQLGANYIGEVLGNVSGGVRTGTIYEGRLELLLNLDLERAVGWSGATFHANAYQIHGRGLSANDLGNNFMIASNIEAQRSTRLFDLWLEQGLLDGRLSIRAGQLAADDEFIISQYAANFVNSTFGWPAFAASDLPSGGPAYPLATPGLRVRWAPSGRLAISAAVFNGDPAGPGPGNPQFRNASGTSFRFNDGVFAIAEAAYAVNQGKDAAGLPATYKLGAWYHDGSFADQRFDKSGRSLADPASTGVPAIHHNDFSLYGVVDQMIWRKPETVDQGLGAFLRVAGSPDDRNVIDFYADGGINYKGPLPGRDADIVGLAVAYAHVSGDASALDRDIRSVTGTNHPIRDYELAVELTYKAQVTPWWTLQPDFQMIFHPGGHGLDPTDPTGTRPIGDAAILGLRTTIAF